MSSPSIAGRPVAGFAVPAWARPILVVVALVVVATLPQMTGDSYHTYLLTTVGIYAVVAMGLNLLFGYTGQVSLGHGALVAVGAYTAAILMTESGWSFWPAALASAGVAGVVGSVMALPALRLSSWHVALITLFFALVTRSVLVELEDLTGGWSGILGVPRPAIGGTELTDTQLLWIVLGLNVVVFLGLRNLVRSRLGAAMLAVRDAPEAGRTVGVRIVRVKLFAFAASAALAGLGGALLTAQEGSVTPDLFPIDFSIFFLIVVIIGGAGRLAGPLIGTLVFFAVPELLTGLAEWRGLVYGLALMALMVFAPTGVVGLWDRFRSRLAWRRAGGAGAATPVSDAEIHADPSVELRLPESEPSGLRVSDVRKAFGGVQALDGAELDVTPGSVHVIVGPNGSGKTTLLNAITGFVTPDGGTILLDGGELRGRPAETIARSGVARTFQTARLLPEASALENVLLGAYARERATGVELVVRGPRAVREHAALRREAEDLLAFVGLGDQRDTPAASLPHGGQRLLEVARALLARPRLLLMDEPAAGLSLTELEALGRLIGRIRASGVTVLLVEHHVELVAEVADRVTVLDRGQVLVSGPPETALADERVVEAYLGRQG
jgi:branched-chain amino acid transport system permease protein